MMRPPALLLALLLPVLAQAESSPGTVVTHVFTTTQTVAGQPLVMPSPAKLNVSHYTIAPGAELPVHKHPYPRYAYVEAGQLEVTLVDQNQTMHYGPGEFIPEIIDGWHYGRNTGTEPVVLLVIDHTPVGTASNTVLKPDTH